MTLNHAREAECDVEIACTRDGTILGLRGHAYVDVGAYMRTNGAVGARNVAQFMSGPYRIPNIDIDVVAAADQQDAGRHLSRARPLRDRFLPRAAVRHRGAGSRHRPRRIPAPQSRRGSGDAVPASPPSRPYESKDELRQRRLSRHASTAASAEIRLGGEAEAAGQADRRPLSRPRRLPASSRAARRARRKARRIVLEPDGTVSVYVGSSAVGQGPRERRSRRSPPMPSKYRWIASAASARHHGAM